MEQSELAYLLSEEGQNALTNLGEALQKIPAGKAREVAELPLLNKYRQSLGNWQAAACLTMAKLRLHAAKKFPQAERMFFTPEALEQATSWELSLHRAQQLDKLAPPGAILDLGCSLGGDTLALAQYRRVLAYDLDPLRLAIAQANAQALGVAERITFHCANYTTVSLPPAAAAFADPARRSSGKRLFNAEDMQPSWTEILALQQQQGNLAVKLAPGFDKALLPANSRLEFIGRHGSCLEAVLWLGQLSNNSQTEPVLSASIWCGPNGNESWHYCESARQAAPVGYLEAGMYLYEPEPAVIRAEALHELCESLQAHLFDSQIAWLVSKQRLSHPLAAAFRIWEIDNFSLKRLQKRLNALGIGTVEIKKRGFAMEPEELRKRIKLNKSKKNAVIFLTRLQDRPLYLLGERLGPLSV